ncbi:MAG: mannose-6-phosphate isomerase, class I [Salinibacterium sp.]|nr:mannose-6-phosphate isomerase, class I [Salinibacterium sp.]
MFVGITNSPRDYAWGSRGEISALLGLEASGAIEAELWLGAHPGSPSRIVGSEETLIDVVGGRLPFLLKVLAAGSALSLQAHPTAEQARAGFARENAAGIALDAPNRNYKDEYPKPELIYALSDEFDALCGFRSAASIRAVIDTLAPAPALSDWRDRLSTDAAIRDVFEWLITRGDGVDELVSTVVALADGSTPELETAASLARDYPGDPGIVISLMLNRVTLTKGQVLSLPAGNVHAYLRGVGIELMTSSDNVLRGGLTPKHVDVGELLAVLDFRPVEVPYLVPKTPSSGVNVFRPEVPDFVLVTIEDEGSYELTGPGIALCTDGDLEIVGRGAAYNLSRGDAVYITPDEGMLEFAGLGTVFLATTGRL